MIKTVKKKMVKTVNKFKDFYDIINLGFMIGKNNKNKTLDLYHL